MMMKTEWQDMAPPIPKGQPMPQTREYWIQLAARDQELILEQREESAGFPARVITQEVNARAAISALSPEPIVVDAEDDIILVDADGISCGETDANTITVAAEDDTIFVDTEDDTVTVDA